MNTSKIKKILSIVIITLILALTVTTIVLAIVPKRLYNPVTNGYMSVAVYRNKKDRMYFATDDANAEDEAFNTKLSKLLSDSVKDNVLSSIFQGTGKFKSEVTSRDEGDVMTNVAKVSDGMCLVFMYDEEQTLMFNGKVYKNPQATDKDKTVTYTQIFMPIANDQDFQERTVYLADSSNQSDYQIKFLAHQSDIYDLINNLDLIID